MFVCPCARVSLCARARTARLMASQPGARRVLVGAGVHVDGDAHMLQLPHPATGAPAAFLHTPAGQLLELNWHKTAYTSWFVGDSVLEGVCAA